MEALEECLFMDKVPPSWERRAYPSLLSLASWHVDLMKRLHELESWVVEFQVSYDRINIMQKQNHYKHKNYNITCLIIFLASSIHMVRWIVQPAIVFDCYNAKYRTKNGMAAR